MTKAQTTKAAVANPFEQLAAVKPAAKQSLAKTKVAKQAVDGKAVKKTAAPAKVTKKSQAVTFYKKNIKKGKSVVIDFFKGDLSMTDAGANSYFYAIKKEVSAAAAA